VYVWQLVDERIFSKKSRGNQKKLAKIYSVQKFFRQTNDGTVLHLANVAVVKMPYYLLTYCLSVFPLCYFVLKKDKGSFFKRVKVSTFAQVLTNDQKAT
jgi:hypothetical protein